MREHYRKLFYDPIRLNALLNLRSIGYSIKTLAIIFQCDASSIRHQLDKHNITPNDGQGYALERLVASIINRIDHIEEAKNIIIDILRQTQPAAIKWEEEYGHRYSKGKTYKEYLDEMRYPPKKL